MNPIQKFEMEKKDKIEGMVKDSHFASLSAKWFDKSIEHKYSYNFTWLGRPVIQYPQDLLALQEIIWNTKPNLIVETGIAHGGSLIFYASMLELLGGNGMVLGIDINIREHNRQEIENHPLFKRIEMLEGSSTEKQIVNKVYKTAEEKQSVMVVLDSLHSHEHVLNELKAYSPLVRKESYLVVFDTIIQNMPDTKWSDRPWGIGNNPYTAVEEFLQGNNRFVIDTDIDARLMISAAPRGYLKCVRD